MTDHLFTYNICESQLIRLPDLYVLNWQNKGNKSICKEYIKDKQSSHIADKLLIVTVGFSQRADKLSILTEGFPLNIFH